MNRAASLCDRGLFALTPLMLPLLALQEGGEHAAETFLGLPRWLWLWANLFLFLGVLGYFIVPAVRGYLEARAREIRESLERSRDQRREAQHMKASLDDKIEELEREMDQVLTRAREQAEQERQEILVQADRERERLLTQTQEEIRLRVEQARKDLTRHTAQLASHLARAQVREEIGPDDRQRIFDDSLESLERLEGKRR